MSLINQILEWSITDLTEWQRDALRRLFEKQALRMSDYEELYIMLKSDQGLTGAGDCQPIPLSHEHIPSESNGSESIILHAIHDLKNVNRIEANQKIIFSPTGMTVIYGGNGSGKSGYSRVLKRACRARDISEQIHPNALNPIDSSAIPEAVFDIMVSSGAPIESLPWKLGSVAPEKLSNISVFDARCARHYLDDERDVAYLPYGLDIVENLAQRVLPALSQRLNLEIDSLNTDANSFSDLIGDTAVGKIVASLGASTNLQSVVALATLTNDEINRHAGLKKSLSENDPEGKAKSLRLLAQRINELQLRINRQLLSVDKPALDKCKASIEEFSKLAEAEKVAAREFRSKDTLLPGTGEPIWRELFESARKYSTEAAYPNAEYPNVGSGAQCPLCQQQIDSKAAERLVRFGEFIKRDIAKKVSEKRKQISLDVRNISNLAIDFGLGEAIGQELRQLDNSLYEITQKYETSLRQIRAIMLKSLETQLWTPTPAFEVDPRPALKVVYDNLVAQATDLEKTSDKNQRLSMEKEFAELNARVMLNPRAEALGELIKRIQIKSKLVQCKSALNTKPISDKAKELASSAITGALKNALDAEFKSLGVGHIKTRLTSRVEQGKMKHKLILDLPTTKKLDEILSEGEKRAIAIGSFLSELRLSGHKSGIIFDDPVSSLDHHRRRKVAVRLVEESKIRQVIIFTHDTIFLGELESLLERQGVSQRMYHLEWRSEDAGHVIEGLPWEHMSYRERLVRLEKLQQDMAKSWIEYPGEDLRADMRSAYSSLRATIERVVQDVLFGGVVDRHKDYIQAGKLKGVVGITDIECDELIRLYTTCHGIVDAHDPSSAKNASVPTPTQLGNDIEDLRKVVGLINERKKRNDELSALLS
jgi:recombinational DNA repair ATPase RecF